METALIVTVEEFLRDKKGVSAEKMRDSLKESSANLKEIMDTLDESIEEGEFEEVVSGANSLKESLINLGLEELSMVAGNIETAASSTSPLYLNCYYMRLRRELLPLLNYND